MAFTKSAADPQPTASGAPQAGLKKNSLGTRDIVFMLVSAAAPLTIVVGVSPLALAVGGAGAPVIYVAAALGLALFAVGFMALTRHILSYSGFYGYIAKTLGRVAGLGAGLTAWLSYNGIQIGLYGLLGIQANLAVKQFTGLDLPWWVYGLVSIAAVHYLGWRGIDVGAKVVGVLLTLETVIVVILAVAVLSRGGAHGINLDSFTPSAVFTPGMAAVLSMGFSAFMGFESGALYREEARNPDRTVPRATYISIAFIGAFYAFAVWVLVQAGGFDAIQEFAGKHLDSGDTAYVLAGTFAGDWLVNLMSVLIVTSIFASQLAFHNTINRYTLSLGREGIFPRAMARISRHQTPGNAGVLQTGLSVAAVVVGAALSLDPFTQFVVWLNSPGIIGILGLQALMGIGVVMFFLRRRERDTRWYVIPSAVLATLVMVVVIWLSVTNIQYLTGIPAGDPINTTLLVIAPVTFVLGLGVAWWLKKNRTDVFARIGHS
ncbi:MULTISPECIES: APC family permease [Arthrobacter]|uniref:APC family permease n=2 Tax=Arthrobacter TaxID=1663 RepID=A0ABU9KJC7_9MICC|nr:APC family permease [Arthrobacter sp. YJM1]MDP5225688.1 APC family permease [Arthrobacter sp. YJM1]